MSLAPLREGRPTRKKLGARASKIALHELGHALDLDHHAYGDTDCLMVGDTEIDSVSELDKGSLRFCRECRSTLGL